MPASVTRTIGSAGQALPGGQRRVMESHFGRDFGDVRIHTDHQAAESARAVDARAYTVGQHIAFDHGQYRPHTPAGQQLLAHELAHTIQQRGLQRAANTALLDPGVNSRYEREAERAARSVSMPTISAHPGAPAICRVPAAAAEPAPAETETVRAWEPVPPGPLANLGVKEQSKLRPGEISPTIRAFKMGTFHLPKEKGPVLDYWKSRAKGVGGGPGGLESFVDADGTPRSALKQERPSTDQLRQIWLTRIGFSDSKAAAVAWQAAGGDQAATFEPKVAGKTGQMDHIIELQIGGNNIPENIQVLDAANNQSSGSTIFQQLKTQAVAIRKVAPGLETVILNFDDVDQAGVAASPFYAVSQKMIAAGGALATDPNEASESYDIVAAVPTALALEPGTRSPRKAATVPIEESKFARTRAASTLIPGMALEKLHLKAKGNDEVTARIDTGNKKTALPITIASDAEKVDLTVNESSREVKLKAGKPNIAFTYPYLSKGAITHLDYDAQRGLSGSGWITPSLPLLNRLKLTVEFGPDRFAITAGLDPTKLSAPFGAKITKAQIGLDLYPEFKPTGEAAFELASGARKIITGGVMLSADAAGLVAVGRVNVHLPGVDKAAGDITYRAQQWSGQFTVEASQFNIPYLKAASVTVSFDNDGPAAVGKISLGLPGDNEVELQVDKRRGSGFVYSGSGIVKVPGLDPVKLNFIYAGDKLTAKGTTGFNLHGFTGTVTLAYNDGKVSGEGKLSGKKGRATLEDATVRYNGTTGKFSGSGALSYEINPSLIAKAGVDIPEKGPIKVKGELAFTKPIKLFDPFGDTRTLFKSPTIKIPIPGASIGPIGLVLTIDGSIVADYHIGPGELQDTKVAASFEPFEENKDLSVDLQSKLAIPARAGIGGRIEASLAIDALVASVSGGIAVTASVNLDGGVFASFTAHYDKDHFTAKAVPEITAGLVLGLAIDAQVKAQAGIGPFSVETKKVWNLKNFRYDTGLRFGMKAPISYDSALSPAFTPPTLDSIQWIIPDFRPSDMLSKIMSGSGAETES